jgi:AcrR family transcriptional regulator
MGGARAKQASERTRHPTEVRRHLIVEAARSVIAERGLFATSMRDIATAGDVSLGTVTYHFTGIAEILAEVLDGERESFSGPIIAAAQAAPDGRAALREIVDGFIASSPRARQHWVLWLDFWALSAHDSGYARRQSEVYRRWHGDVRAVFERGAADGSLPPAHDAVTEFMAIFDGMAAQAYLPGADLRPAQARAGLHRWIDRTAGAAGSEEFPPSHC